MNPKEQARITLLKGRVEKHTMQLETQEEWRARLGAAHQQQQEKMDKADERITSLKGKLYVEVLELRELIKRNEALPGTAPPE